MTGPTPKPMPGPDRPTRTGDPSADRTTSGGDRTALGGGCPAPGGDRPVPSGDPAAPPGDRTTSGGDRTALGGGCTAPGGDRPVPSGDRPVPVADRSASADARGARPGGPAVAVDRPVPSGHRPVRTAGGATSAGPRTVRPSGQPASADPWLTAWRPASARPPRLRLVCFPHAGGSAQLFRGWAARLPPDIELLAVRYPGRQERLAEPCRTDMATLADEITTALLPRLDGPLALFGHSMGSSVAYETALRLESRHGVVPRRLLVSARSAPHRARRTGLHLRGDDELVAGVRQLGSLGSEAYDIPELRELLLPTLRADYRLIEDYRPAAPPVRLRAPITAYLGRDDPGCVQADVLAWSELTASGDFALRTYPGDHFYLAPREAELVADITKDLDVIRRTGDMTP
ncbi:surfactin synthase thioesterase subunit [Streptomyces umbrinus]|uniref:Surfactin synthase thioesterase subunit n=1 Tax=Streptomyces umbrinus TaxID=67370 RepID=A0ABU0SW32_9ACTN|nr:thioesterase domain-containing protein [Streptomyces umbrinus]MDQ1026936.1 surfactin synthase thioesterase subunit [Streptomyces umbrinus]